jgi:hypothetical protein
MAESASYYASRLRLELLLRNRRWARGRTHVESYGSAPAIVYAPEAAIPGSGSTCAEWNSERHGNFFDAAYCAIRARPEWLRRFDKVHAQARLLPKPVLDPQRRWRELDSSMSSDALLMNIFCAPGVASSAAVRSALGVEAGAELEFGWKARVPLCGGRADRTEADLRWGSLLIEAKLTENDFQSREMRIVEAYRDFDEVFDRELLPRTKIVAARPRRASEFPENLSQEFESELGDPERVSHIDPLIRPAGELAYASYQLIRSVLAAYASGSSFCVIHDERRPDLREAWFRVMAAVRRAELRVRMKVLTWQELAAIVPGELQEFLDLKYGIVAPGRTASPAGEFADESE